MTVENTLPHGLKTSVLDSDYKAEQDQNLAGLDPNRISVGIAANRPAFGTANRFYYATDTSVLSFDNGSAWIELSATVLDEDDMASDSAVFPASQQSVKVFANLGRRNTGINGSFKVWQRGTATTNCPVATKTYLADRVFVTPVGATMTQERSATVRTGALEKYSLLLTGAASVTTVNVNLQRYEAINIPAIKGSISFSVWVLNNSGADFTPTLLLGTPAAEDDYTTVTNRLTQVLGSVTNGSWGQVTFTVDISGYTNIDNGLQVELQIPSGSMVAGDTVNLAEFQLERSIVVTPFEYKSIEEVLTSCLRYWRKSYALATALGTATTVGREYSEISAVTSSNHGVGISVRFPAMRIAPTITTWSEAGTINKATMAAGDITPTVDDITEQGFRCFGINGVSSTDRIMSVQYAASAELT